MQIYTYIHIITTGKLTLKATEAGTVGHVHCHSQSLSLQQRHMQSVSQSVSQSLSHRHSQTITAIVKQSHSQSLSQTQLITAIITISQSLLHLFTSSQTHSVTVTGTAIVNKVTVAVAVMIRKAFTD